MGRGLAAVAVLVIALLAAPPHRAAAAGCDTSGVPTTSVYLPNITKTLGGPAGWQTPFIVQNVGTAATTLEVSFYRFSDGTLVTCRKISPLAPGTSFADVPNNDTDLPDNAQFSVVARSFGAQVVSVVNQHQGAGERAEALSYVGLSAGATRVALPYVVKSVGGWLTTLIIQNLGTASANVSASFTSADGSRTATLTRAIGAGRSQFIDPNVETALLAGVEYAALLTSDQPIAAVVNAHNDAPTAARPMGFSYNGVAVPTGPVTTYVPYAARNTDGVARGTRLVVQNAGTFAAQPTLAFRKIGASSQQATLTAPTPIAPGRSWSFDLRFAADGTTACPATGSDSCAGEGEHAVVVTGGTLAVLGITLSPATALGLVGSAVTGTRAYLPNVTRTLGGTSGWTTPILIQSAGAGSVTLRWYRFADGSLVTSQTLSGLLTGGGVRVDPRTVAALADNTQYAVVADAQGQFTSLVVELASGGDNAMVYEGFAATVSTAPVATTVDLAPATATLLSAQTQTFTATVRDQFAQAMAGQAVTWAAAPATLGTITAAGLFTAGTTSGSGTVVATVGTARGAATVQVIAPTTVALGGFTFRHSATNLVDLYTEASISSADAQTLSTAVGADVVQVQTTYGRTFASRPPIYAFPTTAMYTAGLTSVLGMPASDAAVSGPQTCGVFYWTSVSGVKTSRIAINWEKVQPPITCPRHEVTHMMVDQIAKPTSERDVPAWLNEGSARLEEFTVSGTNYWLNRNKYSAASMVATRDYFTVADLTSQKIWNARTGDPATHQYYEASQLVQLLRSDVGTAGVTRILDLFGSGQPIETAFQTVTGTTLASFAASAPNRIQALSPFYPAIATAQDEPGGRAGLSYVLYGFQPSSTVNLDIRGQSTGVFNTDKTFTVNAYGVRSSYLGPEWRADTYVITATGLTPPSSVEPGKTVTVTVTTTKPAATSYIFPTP